MHSQERSPTVQAGPGRPLCGRREERGLCFSEMGCWPSGGPLPPSRSSEEGDVPPVGSRHPPPHVFSSHCDFALPPTETRCGPGAPSEARLGSRSGLPSFWGPLQEEGDGLFSPSPLFSALPPPPPPLPNPQDPWLASLAGSRGPDRWDEEAPRDPGWVGHSSLLLLEGSPLPTRPHVHRNRARPQDPLCLQDVACGGRSVCVCECERV